MSAEIQVLMWALAAFGAVLSSGVVAGITLLWQMKALQVAQGGRLDSIQEDVHTICQVQERASQERANLEGRVNTLELVRAQEG